MRAVPCPCGHRTCKDWHISGIANVQGVSFTEEQAKAVAEMLSLPGLVNGLAEAYERRIQMTTVLIKAKDNLADEIEGLIRDGTLHDPDTGKPDRATMDEMTKEIVLELEGLFDSIGAVLNR